MSAVGFWTVQRLAEVRWARTAGASVASIAEGLRVGARDVDRALFALLGRTPAEAAAALAEREARR